MIEIRELVIRTTVEESNRDNRVNVTGNKHSSGGEKEDCCAENIELMLQIIKDKKER
jgi:hypothetical protein